MSRGRSPHAPGALLRRVLRRLELAAGGVDWRRFVLDADVLRETMAARACVARHRASLPDAAERERRLAEASASYRSAAEPASIDGNLARFAVDGLTWWAPVRNPSDAAVAPRAWRHQNFPYRAITQTREIGIGGIMLDIGANTGRMSIPRVLLGDVQVAYCAEPEPLNYACLVRNVADNGLRGLVLPDRVAIGSENTSVRMMLGRTPGGHRVINPGVKPKRETIEVRSETLDDWCDRLGIDEAQVSFVKVDTQGSELHVLRGAQRLLARTHVAWQIEVDVGLLRERGFAAGDLFAVLQRHFTHWIDLNRQARGPRVREVHALPSALSYIQEGKGSRTDVLVFTLQAPSAGAGQA